MSEWFGRVGERGLGGWRNGLSEGWARRSEQGQRQQQSRRKAAGSAGIPGASAAPVCAFRFVCQMPGSSVEEIWLHCAVRGVRSELETDTDV